jgi:aldose 1-epimerase
MSRRARSGQFNVAVSRRVAAVSWPCSGGVVVCVPLEPRFHAGYGGSLSANQSMPRTSLAPIELAGRRSSVATLEHGAVRVRLLGYGATVMSVECPDRTGRIENVVAGFTDPARYLGDHPYFGSTVGRFANRIRHARAKIGGRDVQLTANENGHQLHGGPNGFHRAWFDAAPLAGDDFAGVSFTTTSPDGDQGFPGNLDVRVDYRLYGDGSLRIDFSATTDEPTIVNLTHHGYWQLAGPATDVRRQLLWIAADEFVPLDDEGIPTGGRRSVEGTPLDFREPRMVGERIGDAALAGRRGYDHAFFVRRTGGAAAHVATLTDPESGRRLEVCTTEPALQLYTGQLLDRAATGSSPFAALCLETGQPADCPNQPDLGNASLAPGERYAHTVIYRLGTDGR